MVGCLGLAILGGAVLLFLFRSGQGNPTITVPTPLKPDDLEPQLRAYVEEKVRWVREAPRDPHRHVTLGLVYAANGLWAEARSAFENVVRFTPEAPLAHMYIAVCTQELGETLQALDLFRRLTRQFPTFPQGFYRLGEASLRAGLTDEAQQAFARLTQLEPREWRGHAGLGEVFLRRGDPAAAAHQLERALELDPNARIAHYLLGQAYRGLGRLEDAQLHLSLGLDAQHYPMPDPWAETAADHMRLLPDQMEIATRFVQAGRAPAAIRLLETALDYQPTNSSLSISLANTYTAAGAPEKAQVLLRKVLEVDPRNVPAQIALSTSLHACEEDAEALEWANQAVALAPDSAPAHLAKANALLGLEQDREALEAIEAAARCDPKNGELRLEMGDVWLRNLNRPDEALRHYEAAANLSPALVSAHVRLATLYAEAGRTNDARSAIERIRRLDPASPTLPLLESGLNAPVQTP